MALVTEVSVNLDIAVLSIGWKARLLSDAAQKGVSVLQDHVLEIAQWDSSVASEVITALAGGRDPWGVIDRRWVTSEVKEADPKRTDVAKVQAHVLTGVKAGTTVLSIVRSQEIVQMPREASDQSVAPKVVAPKAVVRKVVALKVVASDPAELTVKISPDSARRGPGFLLRRQIGKAAETMNYAALAFALMLGFGAGSGAAGFISTLRALG